MAGARINSRWADRTCLALLLLALGLGGTFVYSQSASPGLPSGPLLPDGSQAGRPSDGVSPGVPADARPVESWATNPADAKQETVVQVRVTGNGRIPLEKVLAHIRTRAGRPFDPELIEEDVRRLTNTHLFVNVRPYSQKTATGRVVIFEVLERPILRYVKYVGNQKIKKKKLEKEAGIKTGDALDPFAVEEARRRLQEYYHSHGFPKARITLIEGDKVEDSGAIFLINEGQKQKILWTDFVGNTIATDGRLRTQIQSKPGFLWIFKGEVDRKQIEEDINRLTAYYRSLGFFRARIGRELHFNEQENWLSLTYVIDEGPRYKVRNVSFIGNTKFGTEELAAKLQLQSGEYFNQNEMKADVAAIQDTYGGVGYVFADIQADPRFLEEPGTLDLVYNVREGEQFRVGKINVQIKGEFPHTRITTVLNRMSIRPGEIVDIRELRASERRLRASGLFEVDPSSGTAPKIVFSPPDADTAIARRPKMPGQVRGQSPDSQPVTVLGPPPQAPHGRQLDLTIQGTWTGGPSPEESSPPRPARVPSMPAQPHPQVVERLPSTDSELARAQAALERALNETPRYVATGLETAYPVRSTQYAAPQDAPPVPADPVPVTRQPEPQHSEPPLRGDFGRPAGPWVIRGQYSSDAGRSLPPLLRGSSPKSSPPIRYTSGSPEFPQTVPPPGSAASPAPSYPSNPYPATSPYPAASPYPATNGTAQGAPAFTPAPGMPPAGTPYGPQPAFGPPVVGYPPPQGGAGGATINDAAPLLGGPPDEPLPLWLPLDPTVAETRTGRLMFSVGVNSEAGLLGSVIVDEQNFDWTRFPRGWEDIRNGVAWRGAGQRFRLEAVPGTEVQRYTINFQDPYAMDTNVSLGLSGYYYNRRYREWEEERLGGRVALGYQFSPDLSGTFAFRGANIKIFDPVIPQPQTALIPELNEVLGSNALYGFQAQLTRDTRDNTFLPTEGSLIELSFEQVIGSFEYPRVEIDLRRYFMLHQRPDRSGRHVLSLSGRAAYTGPDTPIYEHFFAGGFTTLRGFDFRGASPRDPLFGVLIGGEFMLLSSAEYIFPITADDMIRGVLFVDTGTVEPTITDWDNDYRVSVGFGLRVTIPAMGPAPIALDLAVPISRQDGDDIENFSFFVGFLR